MMTPLQIQMMLHYYAQSTPYARNEPAHAQSPAVIKQRNALINVGLLKTWIHTEAGYRCTERGKAYVEFLRAMELPVVKWGLL